MAAQPMNTAYCAIPATDAYCTTPAAPAAAHYQPTTAGLSDVEMTGARYTLVAAAAGATGPDDTGPSPGPRGVISSPAGAGHESAWRKPWMCPRCAYSEVVGPACPRGHDAVRGWSGDFTGRQPVDVELREAA